MHQVYFCSATWTFTSLACSAGNFFSRLLTQDD